MIEFRGDRVSSITDADLVKLLLEAFEVGKAAPAADPEPKAKTPQILWIVQPDLPRDYISYLRKEGFTEIKEDRPLVRASEGDQIVKDQRFVRSVWRRSI